MQKDCIRWEDCVLDSNAFSHAVLNLLESHSRRECGWLKDQLQWIDLQAELVGAIEKRMPRQVDALLKGKDTPVVFWAAAPRSSTDWTGSLLSKALHSAIFELANGADDGTLDALLQQCPAHFTFANGTTLLHVAAAANCSLVDSGWVTPTRERQAAGTRAHHTRRRAPLPPSLLSSLPSAGAGAGASATAGAGTGAGERQALQACRRPTLLSR